MRDTDRLHDLPLPVTWDLLGDLRRRVPLPLSGTLLAIHEETLFRTMLHESLPDDGRPQDAVERWIRTFGKLRREWLDVAHEAVGDAGITPLRVEAIATTRTAVLRLRHGSAARADLIAALAETGPILSGWSAAVRSGRALDGPAMRRASTRFDYCVVASLLAESGALCAGLTLATPILCSEARIAAVQLRALIGAQSVEPRRRTPPAAAGTAP